MLEFFLCTFLAILLSVLLLFYYTVVHAQDTVWRRNQSNELTEAMDKIRRMESELVRKMKELDELREKLQRDSRQRKKALDMSLATEESPDNMDNALSPPSPDIVVTDTGALYDKSPYSEATIQKNRDEIIAERRRSSLMSHGSSRHSSNASIQAINRFMISGKGSRQEAQKAVQSEVGLDDNLWESENGITWDNDEIIAATTRRRSSCWSQSSSRRGSFSADQMLLMSGDTELVTLRPPEAGQGHNGDRRVSWPRVGATRRRHSTFPPENMNKILET